MMNSTQRLKDAEKKIVLNIFEFSCLLNKSLNSFLNAQLRRPVSLKGAKTPRMTTLLSSLRLCALNERQSPSGRLNYYKKLLSPFKEPNELSRFVLNFFYTQTLREVGND